MGFRNKRGSLQLSINAIVILILAITLLGLGLGFIKNQFGSVTEQFGQISQDIENEIIDKLRSSGDILAFDKSTIDAERGKPQDFFIGVKNTDPSEDRCFRLAFYCLQALSGNEDHCPPSQNFLVGGTSWDEATPDRSWFSTFKELNIDSLDVQIAPVKLQISDGGIDTYNMRLELYQSDAACGTGSWSEEPLATKQFFLEVQ